MSFSDLLYTLLIAPLKLLFEFIFTLALQFIDHPGLCIAALSLAMNILVLPLYRSADAKQEEARLMDLKLRDGVRHIKKVFSGDERMMILQTYYRQNHYSPLSALNGSVSLMLEIPFFMAAYQFLSHLEILNGISFGPIADLAAPDGILVIGGLAINLLPILMTAVNLASCALYLKNSPLQTKIQLYGMALFFLVFLYNSPSGLVFYWTLNNVFSLVKTIFYKLKNPRKVLSILLALIGAAGFVFLLTAYAGAPLKRRLLLAAVILILELPILVPVLRRRFPIAIKSSAPHRAVFLAGAALLTVLVGVLIPSTYIAASPQEYVDVHYFHNPMLFILRSGTMAAGTFLVWLSVFYWLASPNGKSLFDKLVWILCGIALVNYLFFGTNLGIISSNLQYERGMDFATGEQILNLLIILGTVSVLWFIFIRWNKVILPVLLIVTIALGGMSAINCRTIQESIDVLNAYRQESPDIPKVTLSKTGKNVVVIMLDRAMGEYVPYIFQEKPELKEQFDGFTYYSNTISYGASTIFAAPALFGGYEYTPVEINKRDSEPLVEKHNEALKVMPVMFMENNFDVTVFDPPLTNYQWISDLSIYNDYPEIQAYVSEGAFSSNKEQIQFIENNYRNFFCFGLMKILPVSLQEVIYNEGQYLKPPVYSKLIDPESIQAPAEIGYKDFLNSYYALVNLPDISYTTSEEKNTFFLMTNNTSHSPLLLQTPDYTPVVAPDNSNYDQQNPDRFLLAGQELVMDKTIQLQHYHVNMTTFLRLGTWMEHLQKNDVYDNTRIILVSDHGYALGHNPQWPVIPVDNYEVRNVESFYPLLMVKDFGSKGFHTSTEFMTNADVPALAAKEIIQDPRNPFTGNQINSEEKNAHDQLVLFSDAYDFSYNTGTTFPSSGWGVVTDSILDLEDCTYENTHLVLKEHALPN